jgi:peptidoglycan/LPS O-acetylase OafA/YrhL
MPDNADPRRAYRADIDGLRAVAIILVVAYHYFGLPGGYIGVDVFFVISGYLITGILLSDLQAPRFTFLDFYARRFRRILPPVLVVIGASLIVGWACLLPSDFKELSKEAWASAVYGVNFLLWHESGYFDVSAATKPLLHLWSLAVEEQFYLVWPALLLLAHWCRRRTDLIIVAILIASFVTNLLVTRAEQADAFYLPLSRLWELALGAMLVQLERTQQEQRRTPHNNIDKPNPLRSFLPTMGLVLILGAATLYNSESTYPGYLAAIPALGAALVLGARPQAWINKTVLACRPMVHIGKRSYSWYLWHWPVLVFATLQFGQGHSGYFFKGMCLIVSCMLAWGAYYWCERPIRRIPVNAENAGRFLTVGIAASMILALLGLSFASGLVARPSDSRLITKGYKRPVGGCTFDGPGRAPNTAIFAPCEIIRFPGRPVVVLIGDSHARALYFGLKPYLDARQVNLVEYTATGCAPLWVRGAQPACAATYEYVLKKIEDDRPDLVILCAHYLAWTYPPFTGYEEFIVQQMAELQHAGPRNVLIVGQMPTWESALPRILNQQYLWPGRTVPTRMFTGLVRESLKIDGTMRSASDNLSLPYFSVRNQLCNDQGCLIRVGERLPEELIQFDQSHMTVSGAHYLLASGLGQRIDSILASHNEGL